MHEIERKRRRGGGSKIINHSNFTFETRMKIENSALLGCHFITWPSAIGYRQQKCWWICPWNKIITHGGNAKRKFVNQMNVTYVIINSSLSTLHIQHIQHAEYWIVEPIYENHSSELWITRDQNLERNYLYLYCDIHCCPLSTGSRWRQWIQISAKQLNYYLLLIEWTQKKYEIFVAFLAFGNVMAFHVQ